MGVRGQNNEAWLKRWRMGGCPVHGKGFVSDTAAPAPADSGYNAERCPDLECDVRVATWPAQDSQYVTYGWLAGPENIRALLIKAGDADPNGPAPGKHGRVVRIAYDQPDEL